MRTRPLSADARRLLLAALDDAERRDAERFPEYLAQVTDRLGVDVVRSLLRADRREDGPR